MEQLLEENVEIIVHRRTPGSGHLTATMSLEDTVAFADAEMAVGRAVIVEIGAESLLVRKGREIADFIRRVLGGKPGKVEVSTITPMAGGQENSGSLPTMEYPPLPMVRPGGYDQPERGRAVMATPSTASV